MTLKQLLIFLLQIIFVFIFSACTSSGGVDDEIFQAEEEEYMESKKRQTALDEEQDDDYEESDVLADNASDVTEDETPIGEITGNYDDGISDEYGSGDTLANVEAPKNKTWVPLKKIPTQPWKQDGKWVNTVYIARAGDDLNQVSIKIYGHANLIEELKNFNPFLKRRDPKVGDKIYYNSPNRPKDRVKFSHYYEDNNQTAMTYDIQAGENIRKIATNLLGHKDSWKEIWATNPQVESKGEISETVTVYYWQGSSARMEDTPPPPPDEQPAPMDPLPDEPVTIGQEEQETPASSEEPPTLGGEEDDLAMAEEDPLQPMPETISDDMDTSVEGGGEAASFVSENSNKIKIVAIAGILLILAAFFIRMIRNRKNRADFDFSQTHIDIDNIEE